MFRFQAVERFRLPVDTKEEYLIRLARPANNPIISSSKTLSKEWMI